MAELKGPLRGCNTVLLDGKLITPTLGQRLNAGERVPLAEAVSQPDTSDLDTRPACERLQEELDLQRDEAQRSMARAADLDNRIVFLLDAYDLWDPEGVFTFPDGETWRRS